MPTSAVVMTTFVTRVTPSGDALELIILWRGTPGWFTGGRSSSSSGGTSNDGWRHRFSQGDLEFEAALDFKTRIANVQGQIVKLGSANVILVDGVDSPKGARVAGTLTVDARLGDGDGPLRILPVLARSKEIRGLSPMRHRAVGGTAAGAPRSGLREDPRAGAIVLVETLTGPLLHCAPSFPGTFMSL